MNTLNYQGIVTITLGSQTLQLKNEGTKDLGIAITKALCGYDISPYLPSLFDVQEKINGDWVSVLKNPLPFVGKVFDPDPDITQYLGKVQLNATIQYLNKQEHSDTYSDLRLCMYSNQYKLLATVTTLSNSSQNLSDIITGLTAGKTAFVQWDMIFGNEEVTSN